MALQQQQQQRGIERDNDNSGPTADRKEKEMDNTSFSVPIIGNKM